MSDDDLTPAVLYGSHPQAVEALATLTEHGIGALIEPPAPGASLPAYGILVVPTEVARACEILGVDPPVEVAADAERRRKRKYPDWVYVLVIFAIAMVVLPATAFGIAYFLVSR